MFIIYPSSTLFLKLLFLRIRKKFVACHFTQAEIIWSSEQSILSYDFMTQIQGNVLFAAYQAISMKEP